MRRTEHAIAAAMVSFWFALTALVPFMLLSLSAGIACGEGRVIAVSVNKVIHPITVEILTHAIEQASREKADLLLIRLNTPGGLLEATRQAIESIVASPVPVVTFVTPSGGRAASAGFFLLESGDIAAMADGTNTGAASVVLMGGQQMDPTLRRKVDSDAAALLRALASKRGRNADLAEKAVFEARSFSEREALENKLVDLVAIDERHLIAQLDGRSVVRFDGRRETLRLLRPQIADYSPTVRERIVSSIADPNIAFILLVLGALGIYIEYLSPGLIFPGVAGGIVLLLGLSALSVLPINWIGAALLLLSFAFFVLEAKFASHGILGAGGVVAMILGALLLVNGPPEVRIRISTALSLALPFAAITLFLVSLVVRARAQQVMTGVAAMQNTIGVALTPLSPTGKVLLRGEYWNAVSAAPVLPGTSVRVIEVQGLTLVVEAAK
ncbi:MAG TPA: nodulation protein NfeD [Bryobacteraceae bacterium]|jgi:membrane-bound serine protease (ClpP class)|nr:nodulation protein NfeD [Bryobacteraceae bacterium]